MSFTPACKTAAPPNVYLVDGFLTGVGAAAGAFSDYPDETKAKFNGLVEADIGRFKRRTSKDGPHSQVPPLFTLNRVKTPGQVPLLLGAGDVVLGFVFLPSAYDAEQMAVDRSEPHSYLVDVMKGLVKQSWTQLNTYWDRAPAMDKVFPLPAATNTEAGQDPGLGMGFHHQVDVRVQSKDKKQISVKKIFWSVRFGLIDVGWPAIDATRIASEARIREAMQGRLAMKDVEDAALGTAAVRAVANAEKDPKRAKLFLETVGKGLAFNLLHEFVHAASGLPGHPFGQGTEEIEGSPRSTGTDLRLKQTTVDAILQLYEKTWCDDVTSGRTDASGLVR